LCTSSQHERYFFTIEDFKKVNFRKIVPFSKICLGIVNIDHKNPLGEFLPPWKK